MILVVAAAPKGHNNIDYDDHRRLLAAKADFTCKPQLLAKAQITTTQSNDFAPEAAGKGIKALCPKLEHSCCTEQNLQELHARFLASKEAAAQYLHRYRNAAAYYSAQDKNISAALAKDKAAVVDKCLGAGEYERRGKLSASFAKEIKGGEALVKEVLDGLLKYHSGFACEICGGGFHKLDASKADLGYELHADDLKAILANASKIAKLEALFNDMHFSGAALDCKPEHKQAYEKSSKKREAIDKALKDVKKGAKTVGELGEDVLGIISAHGVLNTAHLSELFENLPIHAGADADVPEDVKDAADADNSQAEQVKNANDKVAPVADKNQVEQPKSATDNVAINANAPQTVDKSKTDAPHIVNKSKTDAPHTVEEVKSDAPLKQTDNGIKESDNGVKQAEAGAKPAGVDTSVPVKADGHFFVKSDYFAQLVSAKTPISDKSAVNISAHPMADAVWKIDEKSGDGKVVGGAAKAEGSKKMVKVLLWVFGALAVITAAVLAYMYLLR